MTGEAKACVIGWPIAHSRSPAIHRFWLSELGIAGDYLPVAVPPGKITAFQQDFPNSAFVGGNVTVPHKEAAFAAVDAVDAAAEAIGAVNTMWIDGGKLRGDNTDSQGFLANLDMSAENWDKSPGAAVVLGAGGAARVDLHQAPQGTLGELQAAGRLRTAGEVGELPRGVGERRVVAR